MGARYPFYFLADSNEGQAKEAEITRSAPSSKPTHNNIRHGFVYERVPHITLKSIANNTEIDIIWEDGNKFSNLFALTLTSCSNGSMRNGKFLVMLKIHGQPKRQRCSKKYAKSRPRGEDARTGKLNEFLSDLNKELKRKQPLNLDSLPERPADPWDKEPAKIHKQWWEARLARQKEIDASIAVKAEFEYLYDKPYEDKKKVRVAGHSLSKASRRTAHWASTRTTISSTR